MAVGVKVRPLNYFGVCGPNLNSALFLIRLLDKDENQNNADHSDNYQ